MKLPLHRYLSFLNQPYPEARGVSSFFISSLAIAIFIGLFLYLFDPFGMEGAGDKKASYSFIFGLITFVISFGFDLFIKLVLKIHRDTEGWVFWKWMVSIAVLILMIASGNYLFMWWELGFSLSLKGFVGAFIYTLVIGLFPIFFIGLLKSNRALRHNKALAESINKELVIPTSRTVSLAADSTKEAFEIDSQRILFVVAMQNYVVVHFDNGSQVEQKILRTTLNAVEEKLKGSSIERTHRSFLVNSDWITHVDGNAQGLKLSLQGLTDVQIPVSRKYLSNFQHK